MILRPPDGASRLLISQPSHAWLSGQMLAAWGAPGFALPDPAPETILAAEQHDLAWLGWETAPSLNPANGLPHSFLELGPAVHAPMWAEGVEQARAAWGLWTALLVSLHGTRIYTRHMTPAEQPPADRAAIERNAARQGALQAEWIARLGAPAEQVARNSALVGVTDALSLALCFADPDWVEPAPMADGSSAPLTLTRRSAACWSLDPWPFREAALTLRCEAIRLPLDTRWTDQEAMRRDLRQAERVILAETLKPPGAA
ncbi:hypothetical protein BKE38_28355 [Pseudoroseomonas deserti]|uniref:DUF3891 domain-containing protein n=1 Tax=Teichococcus deserti TaxID=1817963 RepID=A0A1V2GUD8_9PROT|nr:DUF3891 family protein [Pseudoroseomonas deserti]ONG44215.1 hypothetical protein BKE38_28355 [Pseudoroseomonas deserti]